jgi:hypothetical protein
VKLTRGDEALAPVRIGVERELVVGEALRIPCADVARAWPSAPSRGAR